MQLRAAAVNVFNHTQFSLLNSRSTRISVCAITPFTTHVSFIGGTKLAVGIVDGRPRTQRIHRFHFGHYSLSVRGQPNVIAVHVDNTFDEHMVPKGHSSDWVP